MDKSNKNFKAGRGARAVALAAALLAGWACRAGPVYTLERIGRDSGLPQSSVRAIAVDKLGFLWVGTETGIARYDGYRFKEVSAPFGRGVAMSIYVDSRNRIWTRWYGRPLTLYDPAQDSWRVFEGADAIDSFDGFAEDADGTIWLPRTTAIVYFDETTGQMKSVANFEPVHAGVGPHMVLKGNLLWLTAFGETLAIDVKKRGLAHRIRADLPRGFPVPSFVTANLVVRNDVLWLCSPIGVYRLNEAALSWESFFRSREQQITACTFGSDGTLWIATYSHGVVRLADGVEQRFRPRANDHSSLASAVVVGVQFDSKGQLWVVTPGVIQRWLGEGAAATDKWERFVHSPDSQPLNPGGLAARAFVEDPSGALWLGSEDAGLVRISPYARKARMWIPPSKINPHVRTPVVDADNNIWMGMNQDGVFRFNRREQTWTHFPAESIHRAKMSSGEVRTMHAARDGSIWAGSTGGGSIGRFDAKAGAWRSISIGNEGQIVFNFLELPSGQFVIGRSESVDEFDPLTLKTRNYPSPEAAPIRASALSKSGKVFLGTHQNGVWEFDPGRGFTRGWRKELSDANVFSLYEDPSGALWIGTWGGGLNRLDPAGGRVQVLSSKQGLPDDTIFGILPGKHGDLWVSTYRGLARIENCIVTEWPCTPKVTVMNRENGLPMSEFDSEAAHRSSHGVFYFGGLEGLIEFDPDSIERNGRPPVLRLSNVSLNDRTLSPFWLRPTQSEAALELEHNFGNLRIDLSALDFNDSRNNRFRYRVGPSSDWISLGATPSIALNELGSGTHRLEIDGTNNDGVWSAAPLKLRIDVRAPWYASRLAYFLYAVLALVGVTLFVRWRERRLQENTHRLEATVAERTRELAAANSARDEFYANVSHEIRTPLTLLMGAANALKKGRPQETQEKLADDLVRHGDSLRRYVESLMTVAHLQSSPAIAWTQEDIGLYLSSLVADFRRIAHERRIELEGAVSAHFVRSYANALDTIFCNLLLNAIRHTPPGGTIRIEIHDRGGSIAIEMVDSGPGIDPKLLGKLFERGPRGEQVIGTSIGYGIGLNLVKQTVLALGGSVNAGNSSSGGARFEVTLPRADSNLPIASYLRAPVAPTPARSPSPEFERKYRGRLLIVEDHHELRAHIAGLFGQHYRIREAASVAEGIESAKSYLPDVVICDVMLPDGEGFDVLAAIRAEPLTDHIGVILLTALADEVSRLKGLTEQADLYVTKPFVEEELILQVQNLVEQRRRLRRTLAREVWTAKVRATELASAPQRESFETRLLAIFEAEFADAACDVDRIANRLALSRKQLERKTRYSFKCSPNVLLTRYRLDKAVILLKSGMKIGDVAERCGFSSQAYFGALYKKRFGHAPSQGPGQESNHGPAHDPPTAPQKMPQS